MRYLKHHQPGSSETKHSHQELRRQTHDHDMV